MADELTLDFYMKFLKGTMREELMNPGSITIDVAGTFYLKHIKNIGTSAETLDIGDITTPGYIIAHNMNAAGGNFIELGYDSTGFVPCVKIRAISWCCWEIPAAGVVPQAKADTGASNLQYFVVEA